jgi:UPF0755 protein
MSDGTGVGTPAPAGRRRRIGLVSVLGILFALALLLSVGAIWFVFFRSAGIPSGEVVKVVVPAGADTREIAARLADAGVVRNANAFRVRVRLEEADGRLQAGTYEFVTGADDDAVIRRLEAGVPAEFADVTIPEGFTIAQIAERVQQKTGISAEEFRRVASTQAARFQRAHPLLRFNGTATLEGYLFPKTYRVNKQWTPVQVIDVMLTQFDKESAALDLRDAGAEGLSLHDVVTIASMIEREARLPRERPLVSSVIHNRLERGMNLEIDATVQYVVGNKRRLLYRDLNVESPYNTYLHKGLPPGPIASPGSPSLEAAAHPASTSYLYYVLTGRNGSHTFTTNKADFLKAKQRASGGLR